MGKHRTSPNRQAMPAHVRGLKAHRPECGRTGVYDLQFELLRRATREHYVRYTGLLVTPAEEFAVLRLLGRVA